MNALKKKQLTEEEIETQKRKEEQHKLKMEALLKKKEEYKENLERKERQKVAAEETKELLKQSKKKKWYTNTYNITYIISGIILLGAILLIITNKNPIPLDQIPIIDDLKIKKHNDNSKWKQGISSFWKDATMSKAEKIFKINFSNSKNIIKCLIDNNIKIPKNFDTRTSFKNCKLKVKNQNRKCSGSYAIAIATTMSERLCINSNKNKLNYKNELIDLSAQELLSCDKKNKGCLGGYLNIALNYIKENGLVSEKCFQFKGNSKQIKCGFKCKNGVREKINNYCVVFGENDIKKEIIKNGPLISLMKIYYDFLNYKKGIYITKKGEKEFKGMHAIKIIGWGENNEGKYWIIENSWGDDWGEKGYARIGFGQNFLFENYAYAIHFK